MERLLQGIGSTLVPLLLMVAASVILPPDEAMTGDPVGALIQAGTWLVIGIPLRTAVWVYLTLQMGLNRLGRGHLTLQPYRGDRSLGLRPVGKLAFTGFWMLVGSVGALVLTARSDLPGVVLGIGVLVAGVGLFFLSLRRLHRQMATAKRRELDRALDLYMQAYQAVRDEPTLEVLQRQVSLLNAAEVLEAGRAHPGVAVRRGHLRLVRRHRFQRCGHYHRSPDPGSGWAVTVEDREPRSTVRRCGERTFAESLPVPLEPRTRRPSRPSWRQHESAQACLAGHPD